jgi:hypothetical protein
MPIAFINSKLKHLCSNSEIKETTCALIYLDCFKNCCLIILCSSSEHIDKKALLMQLILLAHEVKDCVDFLFVVG